MPSPISRTPIQDASGGVEVIARAVEKKEETSSPRNKGEKEPSGSRGRSTHEKAPYRIFSLPRQEVRENGATVCNTAAAAVWRTLYRTGVGRASDTRFLATTPPERSWAPSSSSLTPLFHFKNPHTTIAAIQHHKHYHLLAILTSENEIFICGTQYLYNISIGKEGRSEEGEHEESCSAPLCFSSPLLSSLAAADSSLPSGSSFLAPPSSTSVRASLLREMMDRTQTIEGCHDPSKHMICLDALPTSVSQVCWGPWENGVSLVAVCPGTGMYFYHYAHRRWTRDEAVVGTAEEENEDTKWGKNHPHLAPPPEPGTWEPCWPGRREEKWSTTCDAAGIPHEGAKEEQASYPTPGRRARVRALPIPSLTCIGAIQQVQFAPFGYVFAAACGREGAKVFSRQPGKGGGEGRGECRLPHETGGKPDSGGGRYRTPSSSSSSSRSSSSFTRSTRGANLKESGDQRKGRREESGAECSVTLLTTSPHLPHHLNFNTSYGAEQGKKEYDGTRDGATNRAHRIESEQEEVEEGRKEEAQAHGGVEEFCTVNGDVWMVFSLPRSRFRKGRGRRLVESTEREDADKEEDWGEGVELACHTFSSTRKHQAQRETCRRDHPQEGARITLSMKKDDQDLEKVEWEDEDDRLPLPSNERARREPAYEDGAGWSHSPTAVCCCVSWSPTGQWLSAGYQSGHIDIIAVEWRKRLGKGRGEEVEVGRLWPCYRTRFPYLPWRREVTTSECDRPSCDRDERSTKLQASERTHDGFPVPMPCLRLAPSCSSSVCHQLSWAPLSGRSFMMLLAVGSSGVVLYVFPRPPGVSEYQCYLPEESYTSGPAYGGSPMRPPPHESLSFSSSCLQRSSSNSFTFSPPPFPPPGTSISCVGTAPHFPSLHLWFSIPVHCGEVMHAEWNSTGTQFVTSHRDSAVHVWRVVVAHARRRLVPLLTRNQQRFEAGSMMHDPYHEDSAQMPVAGARTTIPPHPYDAYPNASSVSFLPPPTVSVRHVSMVYPYQPDRGE